MSSASSNQKPWALSFYVRRRDAERARNILIEAGINSKIRTPDDCPDGCRVNVSKEGFILWVDRGEVEKANEFLRQAAPAPLRCEICGVASVSSIVKIT